MTRYREAFDRRMAMAGIKPHHRIALGVSGGADSMALCVLAAGWKERNFVGRGEGSGFIDGILAIVVDHRLRPESSEEAEWVGERVSRMGIRCKISSCDWPAGMMPRQGHLEEAAREMRYRIFQDTCIHESIGVLLVAHHADDQAELLILRLSRNSGVLGIAGMAFVSQLFPKHVECSDWNSSIDGILLVRPLLEFSKNDLYQVCQEESQPWVEDPSNQSSDFARNRIRKSLKTFSNRFRSELQALVSACRLTRSFVELSCLKMMEQSVTITDHGYVIVNLEKLKPWEAEDLCLSRFLTSILQFVSQRHRQIRGVALQMMLDYIRKIPCKDSRTVAGCYVCPSPGSKGTRILVCCSSDSPQPMKMSLYKRYSFHGDCRYSDEIKEIIGNAKCFSGISMSSDLAFLPAKSCGSVLQQARQLNIISDETCRAIQTLQLAEKGYFNKRIDQEHHELDYKSRFMGKSEISIACGQMCLFMNRFQVRWEIFGHSEDGFSKDNTNLKKEVGLCGSCTISSDARISVRCMVEADWLLLATLSKSHLQDECGENQSECTESLQSAKQGICCSDFVRLSANKALEKLKCIPAVARRSLPVLVDSQGMVLSIPSIDFQSCCIRADSVFKPQVPLGGGFSSYI